MSIIIAILLWINALVAGNYTQSQFDAIQAANQSTITAIQNDSVLLNRAQTETNPSVVTIDKPIPE